MIGSNNNNEIRPVFIAYPAIYSLLMLNYLVCRRKIKFVGIVLSTSHIKMRSISFSFLESFYILCKKSGLRYALYMFFIIRGAPLILTAWRIAALLTGKRLSFKSFNKISKEYGILLFKTKNINSSAAIDFINSVKANILVSCYNNQILKYEICKKFTYRAINIHNAYLPDFSGLDSAFETLYHDVKYSGATIHYIYKKIDTGKIIAQEKISVYPNDTVFSLNIRQWLRGARMLPKVLNLIKNEKVESYKQDFSSVKYPYRSFPDRLHVREALKKGKHFISFKEIFIPPTYIYGLFGQKQGRKKY